jgi:predicted nucleotidyltransferase
MTVATEATVLAAAHRVAAAIGPSARAVYVVGSVAVGAFEPGRSDLDMAAVLEEPDLDGLVERVLAIDVSPARQLELVGYENGRIVLNLNTDPLRVERGPAPEEWFWFVLDRAVAQEYALALHGPPWAEEFPPVTRAEALDALEASLAWHEEHEAGTRNAVLNAVRGWYFVETGEWVSKPAAERWLLARVRAEVAARR